MFNLDLLSSNVGKENLEDFSSYHSSFTSKNNNRLCLDGKWKFKYLEKFDEKYLNIDFDPSSLEDIKVPSNIEIETNYSKPQYLNTIYPFEIEGKINYWEVPSNNPCAFYYKDIEIEDIDKDIYLEINGFESAIYLFVNSNYVGFSTHGFVTNKFKIDEYLKKGKNRITILLFKYSLASWITDQDMWRLTGLFRSINLLTLKRTHFEDIEIKTNLASNLDKGELELNVKIKNPLKNTRMSIILTYKNEVIFSEEKEANEEVVHFKKTVENLKLWSSEIPNLYDLTLTLSRDNEELETSKLNVGFRKIEIKNGVILLNNKRIIFKGVNRHEFDYKNGRVVSSSLTEYDIQLLKRNNFNSIRTSHYPDINEFYELCDKYGILVMDETAIETHGTWSDISHHNYKDPTDHVLPGNDSKYLEFILDRGRSMLERDKNHPCIVSWSDGNESYMGKNLLALSNYFRKRDKSRFVHYEGCSWLAPKWDEMSDVVSRMYAKPKEIDAYLAKDKSKPYILCEFEHSMGNSTGNFDEYMALTKKYEQYQGGFIWDYVDQGIYKDGLIHYGGDFKEYPHDGNFCADGIVNADRSETSKIHAVKYYYQDLVFDISKDGVKIKNENNFRDTSYLTFEYKLFENEELVLSEPFKLNIKPSKEEIYKLKSKYTFKNDKHYYVQVSAYLKEDTLYATKGYELMYEEKFIKSSYIESDNILEKVGNSKLRVNTTPHFIYVEGGDLKVVFTGIGRGIGGLEAIFYKGKRYLYNAVYPTLYRPTTDNDATYGKYLQSFYLACSYYPIYNPMKNPIKIVSQSEDEVVIEVNYSMINGILFKNFKVLYTIYSSETIKVEYIYKRPRLLPKPPLVGLKFKLDKSMNEFTYIGLGREENYLDRYKGQKYGKYTSSVKEEFVKYSKPQECGNHLFTRMVSIKNGEGSLDFYSLNKNFSFKYLEWNEFEIENAYRYENLPKSNFNYLTICAFNKGVGGDDSWGGPVHDQYTLNEKETKLEFFIKVK